MHNLLNSVLCISLLLQGSVTAVPTNFQPRSQSFKVDRVATAQLRPKNHANAIKKAYAKYGIPLPAGFNPSTISTTKTLVGTNSSGNGQTGQVTNDPTSQDTEFLAPVSFGGQTLMMDFDTGSSDTWVFNTGLPAADTAGHTDFNAQKSSTFKALQGQTFNISYGDNSGAAGTVGTDTVNIGGATVTSQAVELATAVSSEFIKDTASNGLVGLAFSKLNTVSPTKQKTFFDNIGPSLAEPILTANLKHATAGAYEFGKVDSTQFQGDLQWTDVDATSGFWQFASSSFSVGDGAVQQNTDNSPAIADTGTSLLLVDNAVINGYYTQVPGAELSEQEGGVVFPCGTNLPDLHVAMGPNYMATIPGSVLNYAQIPVGQGANNVNTCFGAIQSSGGQGIQIMGDVMFKAQFVAFNNGNNSIGFAPHAN